MTILSIEKKGDYIIIEYDNSIPFLPEQAEHEYLGYTEKLKIHIEAARQLKSIFNEL